MSQRIFITCCIFFILCAAMSSSCTQANNAAYKNDPYGILEAEELGGQPARLIKCSQNEKCPDYAQALFWLAADILSEASAETEEVEGIDFGLSKDMSIEAMTDKIGPQLEDLLDHSPPIYDFSDVEFKQGLEIMEAAYRAGSMYASNELGLLYMEHDIMKDLDRAEKYFKHSLAKGDTLGGYNLARIVRMQTPDDYRGILKYLKLIAKDKNKDFYIMYMLGLEFFGTQDEKQMAEDYFEANKGAKFGLSGEFDLHFNTNISD